MCRWLACESNPSIIKVWIWIFLTINGWKQYLQCDSMRRTTASRNIARSLCRILVIMLRLLLRILVAWILRMCRNVPVTIALPTHNLHPSARHLARPRPRHRPRLDTIHPVRDTCNLLVCHCLFRPSVNNSFLDPTESLAFTCG